MDFIKSIFLKKEKEDNIDREKDNNEKELTNKSFINNQKENFRECVICLEEMKVGDKLTIIGCSHIYHSCCIQRWEKKKRICPLCDYSF